MKELFLALSHCITERIAEIRIVDLDTGQLNRPSETLPIETPAVLLSFASGAIEELDSTQDVVSVQITARLVLDASAGETASTTPEPWRERALAQTDLVDRLSAALRGFSTAEINPLTRVAITPEQRGDGLWVCSLVFSGSYLEYFA